MSVEYRVELSIGDNAWTVTRGDEPDLTLTGGVLLAPLTVGWKMPNSPLWPAQPEPTTARVAILFPTAQAAASLDIGNPVHLQIFAGVMVGLTELPTVRLAGRVAQKVGRPVHAVGLDAWRVDIVVADYTADLAETEVAGEFPFQGINVLGWVQGLFDLAGLPAPGWGDGGYGSEQLTLNEGRVDSATLAVAVDRYLRTYADAGEFTDEEDRTTHEHYLSQGWRRGIVRALLQADGTPLPIAPWRIEWITKRNISQSTDYTTYPAKFGQVGGEDSEVYGIVVGPPPEGVFDLSCAVDANYVEFNTTWVRTKNTTPNKIVVTNNTPDEYSPEWRRRTATLHAETPIIARIKDCLAVKTYNAAFVAQMYLPETAPTDRDAVDKFVWRASKDPAWPMLPSWFPDASEWAGFGRPILVHNIAPTQSPAGETGFYAGVLDAVDFTISGGEFRFDFALRPGAPKPGGTTDEKVIRFSDFDVDGPFGGITFAQLDHTANRLADYRLVRTIAIDYP